MLKTKTHKSTDITPYALKMKKTLANKTTALKKNARSLVSRSIKKAMRTSHHAHNQVANYAYNKPYRSLGAAMLVGAMISGGIVGFLTRK